MLQGTDNYNQILTVYAQGSYVNPGETVDLSRLLFPEVAVDEALGCYDKWTLDPAYTAVDATLARNQTAHRISIERKQGYYNCAPQALEIAHWVPALMQKSGPRYREAGVRTLMSAQFVTRQVSAVDLLHSALAADTALAIGDTSDAIENIDKLCEKVAEGTMGRRPSHLIMGRNAWNRLKNHKSVKERCHALDYAIKPEAFADALAYQGVKLIISDVYAKAGDELKQLLADDIIALYNEESPSLNDLSFGKEFTLSASGPEVISYKDRALYDVDVLMWSSDRQVTNTAAAARLTFAA